MSENNENTQEGASAPEEEGAAQKSAAKAPLWQRIFFSPAIRDKSQAQKIAYLGVITALCIIANTFEIKSNVTQFSFTMYTSILSGMLVGPLFGFCACFLGDAIGYVINGAGFPYYWWVALSVAMMALLSGLIMNIPWKFKGSIFVKLALICFVTFFLCSFLINTTGMYYIGLDIYMEKDFRVYLEQNFGGNHTFWIYTFYRYFIKLQILNCIVNYALLFATIPTLASIKKLQLDFH